MQFQFEIAKKPKLTFHFGTQIRTADQNSKLPRDVNCEAGRRAAGREVCLGRGPQACSKPTYLGVEMTSSMSSGRYTYASEILSKRAKRTNFSIPR